MTLAFGELEFALHVLIWEMTTPESWRVGAALTSRMSFAALVQVLDDLRDEEDEIGDQIETLVRDLRRLNDDRNRIVHSAGGMAPDRVAVLRRALRRIAQGRSGTPDRAEALSIQQVRGCRSACQWALRDATNLLGAVARRDP